MSGTDTQPQAQAQTQTQTQQHHQQSPTKTSFLLSVFELYSDKTEIQPSEAFYLVCASWFNAWTAFSNFAVPQMYCFPVPRLPGTASTAPPSTEQPPQPPGPIDNTEFIEATVPDTLCLLSTGEDWPKDVRPFNMLKPGLKAGVDYVAVPGAVWNALAKEFSVVGSGGIERRYDRNTGDIDAYPPILHIKVYGNPFITVNVVAAREATVVRIKEGAARVLAPCQHSSDAAAQLRLWLACDGDCQRLITNESLCVAQLHTALLERNEGGQQQVLVFVLEQRSPGGKWLKRRQTKTSFSLLSTISSFFSGGSSSIGEYTDEEYKTLDLRAVPGVCGLRNMGNTCFMNSALQCLSNTVPLNEYFVSERFRADLHPHNPLGTQGRLAEDFGALLRAMWSGGYDAVSPAPFKSTLGKWVPQFRGYEQQDSQELVAALLDKLHEDLNSAAHTHGPEPTKEGADDNNNNKDDLTAGEAAWDAYSRKNKSVIMDLFHGQLKSTLICPECGAKSTTFDSFLSLSLPLVDDKSTNVQCVLVSYGGSSSSGGGGSGGGSEEIQGRQAAVCYSVKLNGKDAKAGDLRAKMADITGSASASELLLGSMSNMNVRVIDSFVTDNTAVASIRGTIFCYNVPEPGEKGEKSTAVHFTCRLGKETFGIPVIRRYAGEKVQGAALYRDVWGALEAKFEQGKKEYDAENPPEITLTEEDLNGTKEPEDKEATEESKASHAPEEGSGTEDVEEPKDKKPKSDDNNTNTEEAATVANDTNESSDLNTEKKETGEDRKTIEAENTHDGTADNSNATTTASVPTGKGDAGTPKDNNNNNNNEQNASAHTHTKGEHSYPFVLTTHSKDGTATSIPLDGEIELGCTGVVYITVNWCTECFKRATLNPFSAVTVHRSVSEARNRYQGSRTLDECLGLFLAREQLDPSDSWMCPRCKEPRQAFKKMDIWRLPKVFIVHLKRFHCSRWRREKISNDVVFDVDSWDVSKHLCAQRLGAVPAARYRLFAVSNHYGTLNGGHYTAFAKNRLNGKWYLFNDSRCTAVVQEEVRTSSAYMLFYERID